jgi:DNA-directed RNA polymerase specialized sigma24 family protein
MTDVPGQLGEEEFMRLVSGELIDLLLARRVELAGQLDERHEHLHEYLGRLPERQHTAVTRYYFHGEAVQQVAARLSTSAEAIYKPPLMALRSARMRSRHPPPRFHPPRIETG